MRTVPQGHARDGRESSEPRPSLRSILFWFPSSTTKIGCAVNTKSRASMHVGTGALLGRVDRLATGRGQGQEFKYTIYRAAAIRCLGKRPVHKGCKRFNLPFPEPSPPVTFSGGLAVARAILLLRLRHSEDYQS